jgi:hypothetical protein
LAEITELAGRLRNRIVVSHNLRLSGLEWKVLDSERFRQSERDLSWRHWE